jgi:hypothetical protein
MLLLHMAMGVVGGCAAAIGRVAWQRAAAVQTEAFESAQQQR